jgi:hypothetical protein
MALHTGAQVLVGFLTGACSAGVWTWIGTNHALPYFAVHPDLSKSLQVLSLVFVATFAVFMVRAYIWGEKNKKQVNE